MSLPQPIGRQKEVVCLPAHGHVAVLGTAGSGKTTMAIHRSIFLSNAKTDHYGLTLLVTFNCTLVAYLKHLHDGSMRDIIVENYHKFARGYLKSRDKMPYNGICSDPDQRMHLIAKAVTNIKQAYEPSPFFDRHLDVFGEEIRWIVSYGIDSLDQYIDAERIGRSSTRITRAQRKPMFEIAQEYWRLRSEINKSYDWDDLANAVCKELDIDKTIRRYKHIVIDEGQDFSPTMIMSLVKAVPPDGSVTFFGDVSQQIYGTRMSWRHAGLNIAEPWKFEENYRNSRPIARLALAISKMHYYKDRADIVEPIAPTADGPKPTVVRLNTIQDEVKFVISQAVNAAKSRSVAILVRRREDERYLKNQLPTSSIRLHHDMNSWVCGPGIRYGTYHAAKGLEFDLVIMPFCSQDTFPDTQNVQALGLDEAETIDGRLLYVGVTRAKVGLIISYSGEMTSMLPPNPVLYEFIEL